MRNSKQWLIFGGVAAAVAVAGLSYYITNGNHVGSASAPGTFPPAPAFELADAAGKSHPLDEFKGNVVLLHFWASWCPPCVGEIPDFLELGSHFKSRPFKMVALSEDEKWEDAQKLLPAQGLPPMLTSLLDLKGKVADRYGSYQYPETYLLNSRLQIVTKWVGPQDWKDPRLVQLLEQLIKRAEAPGSASASN